MRRQSFRIFRSMAGIPVLAIALWGLVLSGCAGVTTSGESGVEISDTQGGETAPVVEAPVAPLPKPAPSAPPAAPSPKAPVPKAAEEPKAKTPKLEELRFDISANKISAREFFLGLVEYTPFNMVVHPQVQGEVTVSLKNVTVSDVMEVMRNVFGYEYYRNDAGFQVLPEGVQSRIFQVNYLNLSRKGVSKTRISSGQISSGGSSGSSSSAEGSSGSSAQASGSISGSEIDTQSSSDFWKELEASLKAIVGAGEGRAVVVHPQSNVIVVRARPKELNEVGRYLDIIQGNIQRQVILEAKILEVKLSDGYQSGINWSALAHSDNEMSLLLGQTGGGKLLNSGVSEIGGQTPGSLNPSNPTFVDGTLATAFGGAFTAAFRLKDFTAFIELLKTQGDVNVLSSPRIATVNNQKAVIKVGDDEYFVTDVSSDTVTGTTASTSLDLTLTPFFSGIALDVTPQIDGSDVVTLHIHPTVSEVIDQTKVVTTGDKTQTLPLAFSSIRETDSIVRAASGQVIVLGGLMTSRSTKADASVPGLGDIPIMGNLFRHEKNSMVKSELVILLRPIVVHEPQDWQPSLDQSRQNFEQLGNRSTSGWQGDFSISPSAQ